MVHIKENQSLTIFKVVKTEFIQELQLLEKRALGIMFCIQYGQDRVHSQGAVWGLMDRRLLRGDIKGIPIKSA